MLLGWCQLAVRTAEDLPESPSSGVSAAPTQGRVGPLASMKGIVTEGASTRPPSRTALVGG